jgi:hypothetical protein
MKIPVTGGMYPEFAFRIHEFVRFIFNREGIARRIHVSGIAIPETLRRGEINISGKLTTSET